MKNVALVAVVFVLLSVFSITTSANYLVEGSTVTDSVTYPNFDIAMGSQRYAGDGDDFSHSFFTIYTPFQVNDASWTFNIPTADSDHCFSTLLVKGIEIPTSEFSWASSSTINCNGVEIFEGVLDSYSYGSSSFSGSLDIHSALAEAGLPTVTLTEYPDPYVSGRDRFTVEFSLQGDFRAVPEPSTIALLLSGLVGLGFVFWHRK